MARNTITSTVIVPDVLSESNYKEWSNCMKNYLLAQNLWNVVESGNGPSSTDEEVTADWKRKNAAVLHALQISCAPEIFARIMGKTSAKEAWEELAKPHEMKNKWHLDGPQPSSQRSELRRFFEGTIPGKTEPIERSRTNEFLGAIFQENWDTVVKLLEGYQLPAKNPQFFGDNTSLLHLAVNSGDVEGVKKLVQIMSEEEILSQDDRGCTALAYAAYFGKTDIAKCLTTKNSKLLTIPDTEGMIPVVRACVQRFKETTLYLYFQTLEFLAPDKGEHGSLLLHFCMLSEMLDIALDLVHEYPRLAFTRFKYNNRVSTPILTLSAQPSLFPSGTRLSFLQQWIYYGISVANEDKEVKRPRTLPTDVRISVTSIHQNEQNDIKRLTLSRLRRGLSLFFLGVRGFNSMLQKFTGIEYIYKQKLIHECAREILMLTDGELLKLNAEEVVDSGVVPALFQSVQHGIIEFWDIVESNVDIPFCPIDGRTKIKETYAIEYRQEKFFRRFGPREGHHLATWTDYDGNNALHIAAKLGPQSYLGKFSGAALQMQKELQWFKEFESVVPECKDWVNHNGETPWQVFTRDHMNLLKEAQAWMKQTAKSYIIVGTLIITTMFAAAFSVPGGNNGNGFPMFSHKRLFLTYIMSDAISLFAASASVLTFLGILTSRYTEEAFLKSLPTMLITGILTLLISVATMSVAFCAAVSIMLQEKWWVVFSLVLLASIPIVVFLSSQSRLLIEILVSTYGPRIFKRREGILSIMKNSTGKLMKRRE